MHQVREDDKAVVYCSDTVKTFAKCIRGRTLKRVQEYIFCMKEIEVVVKFLSGGGTGGAIFKFQRTQGSHQFVWYAERSCCGTRNLGLCGIVYKHENKCS